MLYVNFLVLHGNVLHVIVSRPLGDNGEKRICYAFRAMVRDTAKIKVRTVVMDKAMTRNRVREWLN